MLRHLSIRDFVIVAARDDLDAHLAVVGQHDGAVRERVRRDRHEHDALQLRMQDRPLRRERVGGRARGRRDDQAVRALVVHEAAIHVHAQLGHA